MKDTPVRIGLEVETQYPGGNEDDPDDEYELDSGHRDDEPKCLPGWHRGFDCDLEFRFSDKKPCTSLLDAYARCDALEAYLKKWDITSFSGCGTHIHLGLQDWLEAKYPEETRYGSSWMCTTPSNLLYGYYHNRLSPLWNLIPPGRKGAQWCLQDSIPGTALWQIHNAFLSPITCYYHRAIERGRRNIPTFEFRMFDGTNKLGAVKGYITLLINMLKTAEKKLDAYDFSTYQRISATDKCNTEGIFFPRGACDMTTLRKEVRAADFQSEPLLDWMSRTEASKSRLVEFEPDISEITNNVHEFQAPRALAVAA